MCSSLSALLSERRRRRRRGVGAGVTEVSDERSGAGWMNERYVAGAVGVVGADEQPSSFSCRFPFTASF